MLGGILTDALLTTDCSFSYDPLVFLCIDFLHLDRCQRQVSLVFSFSSCAFRIQSCSLASARFSVPAVMLRYLFRTFNRRANVLAFSLFAFNSICKHSFVYRMVWWLSWFPSCISFVSKHSSCICVLAFSFIAILLCSFILLTIPLLSMAGLRSWVCGTCTVCNLCPPCAPAVYAAPHCECRENLNQCTCNCATHTHLSEVHQQWATHLLTNHNHTFAAQMNSNRLKRHLLLWLIGPSFLIVLILITIIPLIVFTPAMLRHCALWKSTSRMHRKQLFMRKHNLIEPTSSSSVQSAVGQQLPTVCASVNAGVSGAQLSYADLEAQLEATQRLVQQLDHDLLAARHSRLLPGPTIFSRTS